ncbi:conserved hypothetical protein [Neospora caninum Liverpool]|uniref:Transmembrane protein n=1 Tax=Neospora caninum (strain Liverpool) TaxID=572307 RepID=F0VNF3_NEOCL|nr:conserved hypothetical protein [Neospora caninum Liverpool]CBZ55249.1 conserved hypothetical protein [Neospora caninum Liverpool]CEL69979.1 TPA: hypothetical protein BN1204_056730 [Neospora caninum Liverpool]|eukprot:XP_003885277.1 conserved hypothetical protein [Neospora caninum Liverpool]
MVGFILVGCFLQILCGAEAAPLNETLTLTISSRSPRPDAEAYIQEKSDGARAPPQNGQASRGNESYEPDVVTRREEDSGDGVKRSQSAVSENISRHRAEVILQEYLDMLAEESDARLASGIPKPEEGGNAGRVASTTSQLVPFHKGRRKKSSTWFSDNDDMQVRNKSSGFFAWLSRHQRKATVIVGAATAALVCGLGWYGWTKWGRDEDEDFVLDFGHEMWRPVGERRPYSTDVSTDPSILSGSGDSLKRDPPPSTPRGSPPVAPSGGPPLRRALRKADLESDVEHEDLRKAFDISPRYHPPPSYYASTPSEAPATPPQASTASPARAHPD